MYVEVCDSDGDLVKCVEGNIKKGLYCIIWDMKYLFIILFIDKDSKNNGFMVLLGSYIVMLFKWEGFMVIVFFELVLFVLEFIYDGVLKGVMYVEIEVYGNVVNDV